METILLIIGCIILILLLFGIFNQMAISKKLLVMGEQFSKLNDAFSKKDETKPLVQKMHVPKSAEDLETLMTKIKAEFHVLKKQLDEKYKEIVEVQISWQKNLEETSKIQLELTDDFSNSISDLLKGFESFEDFENYLKIKLNRLESLFMANKKVLSFEDVIEITGFESSYLYELISSRVIPHSNPSRGKVFFDRDEFEAWLLNYKQE